MKRSQPMLQISALLAGTWALYTLLNTSIKTGLLKGPGIFFYFGQTFGDRFASLSSMEIAIIHVLGLVAVLSIVFHAWVSLGPATAFMHGFKHQLGRGRSQCGTSCRWARLGCGATGVLLVPLFLIQFMVYMVIPALTGEAPSGSQFISQGGGIITLTTIPVMLAHLFTGAWLMFEKIRPSGLLGLSPRGSLAMGVGMVSLGTLASHLHNYVIA